MMINKPARKDAIEKDMLLATTEIRNQIFNSLNKITSLYPDKCFAFNGKFVEILEEVKEVE